MCRRKYCTAERVEVKTARLRAAGKRLAAKPFARFFCYFHARRNKIFKAGLPVPGSAIRIHSPHPIDAMSRFKQLFNLGPVFSYWFRRKDPNNRPNFNLRMMHGINKISMLMFLATLVFMVVRRFL